MSSKIIDPTGRTEIACPLMGLPTNHGLVFGPCIKTKCEWYNWTAESCVIALLGQRILNNVPDDVEERTENTKKALS